MRLIVCGGRNFADRRKLDAALDALHRKRPITLLIHGAATGADLLAEAWAKAHGIPAHAEPARWTDTNATGARVRQRTDGTLYNANAGPDRNALMMTLSPDGILAMPGAAGTDHMCHLGRTAGITVWRPYG